MLQICCECDWDLGVKLPSHIHSDQELLRLADGREFWMPKGTAALNSDTELLAEWSEISFSVDWKKLFREALGPWEVASHLQQTGQDLTLLGFTVGRWSDEVQHADPCDCDLDEENVGDRCMDNSRWYWALMRDEGGHGWSMAFALSEPSSCRTGQGWESPSPPASTSNQPGEKSRRQRPVLQVNRPFGRVTDDG